MGTDLAAIEKGALCGLWGTKGYVRAERADCFISECDMSGITRICLLAVRAFIELQGIDGDFGPSWEETL